MDLNNKQERQMLILTLLAMAAGAAASGLFSRTPWLRASIEFLANFFAGFAVLTLCLLSNVSTMWTGILSLAMASFGSTLWPLLGDFVKRYGTKRANDILHEKKNETDDSVSNN